MSDCIIPADIRYHIADDVPEKNLEADFFFSEQDIQMAMRFAASEIRDITPIQVMRVSADNLPFSKGVIDLVVANLYDRVVEKIDREEIDIKGGAISLQYLTVIRNNLDRRRKERRATGTEAVHRRKLAINLNRAWGVY
jgi:hypothetical protein